MPDHVLVTGGAGYIGSHACKALKAAGFVPVTYDSLLTGWREAVKFGPFEQGELMDRARLDEVFAKYKPVAVMHFAALSQVGEAMAEPGRYWRGNVCASLNLIEATVAAGVTDFVFSSTCATYGDHDGVVLDETTPQLPLNAYGASKRAIEDMLKDFGAAHGLNSVIFRYFNVAGADPDGEVGEFHRPETHLVPLILDAVDGRRPALTIHGTDYPTEDGTCIRDYVHVMDLVDAHVQGLNWMRAGNGPRSGGTEVFCLGTGDGFSVREVVSSAGSVTNRPVPMEDGPRRAGDAVKLVSGSKKAGEVLGWSPDRSTMPQMIRDAWRWHQNGGYDG
ncbi:UDP-glucose 4-epimerase [Paracoccus isoporae]|uniref:UDP-glucose 4-epimerase n=1 Tax=Paracoccus isoporae TaxID=591205 RepID=A0A1G6Z7J5_9RHOB|nr:UDP-glucose 4-epimerase GalE [Paracoccus isoporae]SDD97766.1 UDP-glucose 4-epimerase [Paracoccus isoporae]